MIRLARWVAPVILGAGFVSYILGGGSLVVDGAVYSVSNAGSISTKDSSYTFNYSNPRVIQNAREAHFPRSIGNTLDSIVTLAFTASPKKILSAAAL